jgi:hypothetical protein
MMTAALAPLLLVLVQAAPGGAGAAVLQISGALRGAGR